MAYLIGPVGAFLLLVLNLLLLGVHGVPRLLDMVRHLVCQVQFQLSQWGCVVAGLLSRARRLRKSRRAVTLEKAGTSLGAPSVDPLFSTVQPY